MENAAELVRRFYDAFNRGDFEAASETLHPEIVWDRVADVELPVHGPEAVRSLMEPRVFSHQRAEIHSIEPLGDSVLVDCTFHGVGAASGIELTRRAYQLWRLKDRKAIEFRYFEDREAAVRAAMT
jgi:ketosteroid isomerase-like protein